MLLDDSFLLKPGVHTMHLALMAFVSVHALHSVFQGGGPRQFGVLQGQPGPSTGKPKKN